MTSRIAYNNPNHNDQLGLSYHYELLADVRRVNPLRKAILAASRGRRVLESGAGSGIFSILAARAGARAVYAIEKDPVVAEFFRKNVYAAGLQDIIRIIEKDTRDVSLTDLDGRAVDMIVAEHLSTWLVVEPEVSVMNHINGLLATPAAIHIPTRVYNRVELVQSRYRFADDIELRAQYFGFSGIPRPRAFSKPALARMFDFRNINDLLIDDTVEVPVVRNGVVNGLRLTSRLQVYGRIGFRGSDSLMPAVIIPLQNDLRVQKGDVVRLRLWYGCGTQWSAVKCEAQRFAGISAFPSTKSGNQAQGAASPADSDLVEVLRRKQ